MCVCVHAPLARGEGESKWTLYDCSIGNESFYGQGTVLFCICDSSSTVHGCFDHKKMIQNIYTCKYLLQLTKNCGKYVYRLEQQMDHYKHGLPIHTETMPSLPELVHFVVANREVAAYLSQSQASTTTYMLIVTTS